MNSIFTAKVLHIPTIFLFLDSGIVVIACPLGSGCDYRKIYIDGKIETVGASLDIIHSSTLLPDYFTLTGEITI